MTPALEKLIRSLSELPGIGSKSAIKLASHLLNQNADSLASILKTIQDSHGQIQVCEECHNYSDQTTCDDCRSPHADNGILCVVESSWDTMNLKKHLPSGAKFHVLGGKLSPLNGISPKDLNLNTLFRRLKEKGLKEVILANGPDVEGETTAAYLHSLLNSSELKSSGVKTSRIAFGVSCATTVGSADERSLKTSLEFRREY